MKRIDLLQNKLDEVVTNSINTELLNVKEKINDSIGPYSRFVRIENKKTIEILEELMTIKKSVSSIRSKIKESS